MAGTKRRRIELERAAVAQKLAPIVISTWTDGDEGPFGEPLTAEAETARIRALFDAQYPPGNWIGDLTRLVEADYFGCDPWEAAIALALHRRFLPMRLASPRAKGGLRRLIREHGPDAAMDYVRGTLYPEALIRALKERTEPQDIRLRIGPHRKYLKDAGGRKVAFRPNELSDRSAVGSALFARWLRKQTIKHVERLLEDEITAPVILDTKAVSPKRPTAFYGRRAPVRPFSGRLSEEQRTLLRLLHQDVSYAQVAAILDISRDAAKQRAYRLRLKQQQRQP
jgi:hypothetical protein